MAVGKNGNIHVIDKLNHRVQVFNSSGLFQFAFGGYGSGLGQFFDLTGIALDSAGNIYTVDGGGNEQGHARLQKFSPAGSFIGLATMSETAWPQSAVLDAGGNLYVTDATAGKIRYLDPDGRQIREFGALDTPTSIALNADGSRLYVAAGRNKIHRFSTVDTSVSEVIVTGEASDTLLDFTIDSTGAIFTAWFSGSIKIHNPDGTLRSSFGGPGYRPGQLRIPRGIALDALGNILVADENQRVQKFSPTGALLSQ
jgi:sugar lactone lactonase YvrE